MNQKSSAPQNPSPERHPVISFVGVGADLVFWEKADLKFQRVRDAQIGEPHWDDVNYPNHKLVYRTPLDGGGQWHKFFYAADRDNQKDYNYELTGEQLIRSFLVLREKYYARTATAASAAVPTVQGEFTRPVVGTADTRFSDFVYAEDQLSRTDTELDSLYVMVRQVYLPERLISYHWDEVLQRVIKITRQVVPAQTQTGSGTYGVQVEIQPENVFCDFKITSEVQWLAGDLNPDGTVNYPIQIDSVAGDANYQFPLLLKSIELFGAWAFATSSAPPDYAEDFFFENDIVEPSPGPYDATILRFITDNPDAVRALYPTAKITARAETFGMIKWWATAHDNGNRAFALAKEYQSPASVHDLIELPGIINYVQGGMRSDSGYGPGSESLPATPGFAAYIASTTTIAGVDTRRSRLGLWEVQVTRINAGGATIYNDQANLRIKRAGTGTGIIEDQDAIFASTLTIYPTTADSSASVAPTNLAGTYQIAVWSKSDAINSPDPLDFGDVIRVAVPVTWVINNAWITTTEPAEILPYNDDPARTVYPFQIAYGANGTGLPRTGTITFTNSQTGVTKTFTLVQPG